MDKIVNLRGLVLSKYRTIGEFATALGWSRNKASRVVNGVTPPSGTDMIQMAQLLELNAPSDFCQIFFAELSTKWTEPRAS